MPLKDKPYNPKIRGELGQVRHEAAVQGVGDEAGKRQATS